MPYSVTQDAQDCDGYAVVKDGDGEVMGCHETEADANDQIAAIEASEDERADGVDTDRMAQPDTNTPALQGGTHRSATANASIRMASDGERTTVQVMTEDIARDGMVLQADGVDTEAYMRNPVVLWNHGMDLQRGAVPVARTVDMQRVDGGIRATVEWDDDAFSQEIKRKVKRGFLSAVSIGWQTQDSERQEVDGRTVPVVTRADMTEFSFVSVPADANALVVERSHATADLEAALERVLDRKIDSLRDAATAATPRTEPAADATASDADDVQRDETPIDLDRLLDKAFKQMDTLIDRRLGKA